MIRQGRLGRHLTVAGLAGLLGVSQGLIGRLEKGEPAIAIGTAFEAAALMGIRLFEADRQNLEMHLANTKKGPMLLLRVSSGHSEALCESGLSWSSAQAKQKT